MFNLAHPKLVTLAEIADFLEDHALGSVVPAICMAPDCDHTADLEPDQRAARRATLKPLEPT
ncbi:hypothetical protein [Marinibacterium sp. SX1]|uniref:hypothetical protein n=1 Tax=Marinibacterium sp. SX1 TaxID=3388424 RepID=UPI003D179CB3